jgi:hypothetical protein
MEYCSVEAPSVDGWSLQQSINPILVYYCQAFLILWFSFLLKLGRTLSYTGICGSQQSPDPA